MDYARPPWLVFASSREVYGHPESLPAIEEAPLLPVDVYGRSKVEGERIVEVARRNGLRVAIVRLSNIYGSTCDYMDRVVPAFAHAAVLETALRVDGHEYTFDFTHIDDNAAGIVALIDLLAVGEPAPPPIHLPTAHPTSLRQLAEFAVGLADTRFAIEEARPRSFDVSHFYGNLAHTREVLDWTPRTAIDEGLGRLIEDSRTELRVQHHTEAAL